MEICRTWQLVRRRSRRTCTRSPTSITISAVSWRTTRQRRWAATGRAGPQGSTTVTEPLADNGAAALISRGWLRFGGVKWRRSACGRALAKLKTRAVVGVDTALAQVQTILRTVKEHPLFAKGKQAKRQVLTRLLTEVGQLIVQTRLLVQGLGARRDRVTHHALTTLKTMHEVAKRLIPQIVQWITTGVVAKGKILHAGVTQARALVRHKAGKEVEFGLPYLLSRLGGGYVFGTVIRGW